MKGLYLSFVINNMGLLMLKKLQLLTVLFTLLLSTNALSKLQLDYPELLVVPKASARIQQEANRQDNKLLFNWAVSASATTTLVSALLLNGNVDIGSDTKETSPKVGMAVGAFWLGTNAFLAYKYDGYLNALRDIKRMPVKTTRESLARERAAEEYINELGSLAKKVKWMSFTSNLGASAYMLANSKSESTAQVVSAISMLVSFAPLLFESRWEKVKDVHANYKKKIYAPIIGTMLYPVGDKGFIPGLMVSLNF
jgi:hypothetical protein